MGEDDFIQLHTIGMVQTNQEKIKICLYLYQRSNRIYQNVSAEHNRLHTHRQYYEHTLVFDRCFCVGMLSISILLLL